MSNLCKTCGEPMGTRLPNELEAEIDYAVGCKRATPRPYCERCYGPYYEAVGWFGITSLLMVLAGSLALMCVCLWKLFS